MTVHKVPATGIELTMGGITPELLGKIHVRVAAKLGMPRNRVEIHHWAGAPNKVEVWVGEWPNMVYRAKFTPDLTAEDPADIEIVERWEK